MKLSELTREELDALTFSQKYNTVHQGVADDGAKGDISLLLGGDLCVWDERIAKAVQLYRAGRAPKILVTGCVVRHIEGEGDIVEAYGIAARLEKLGVPKEDIIIEPQARTTDENMMFANILMYRLFTYHHLRDVLLVTSYSHMRRSLYLASLFLPPFLRVHGCPSERAEEYAPLCEGHPHYNFRVHEELRLLHILVHTNQIPDIEIAES
jgi:hypothetical protein